ncbi:MAG: VPS10 domain-containing protein, partial [Myxococcales bacterium]
MHVLAILVAAAAAAPNPLTVDEIVSRHAEARGGAQKLAALQNLRVSGKVVFGDQDFAINAQFAQLRKRPSSIRTEVTFQGLTAIDAFDGQQSWSVDPFQGRKDPFRTSADEARGLAQDADLDGALIGWREKGHQVSSLGSEDVDGTPAHKLRVALKDGDVQYIYLDPDSFLEIRRVSERRVRGSERVTETDYGAYTQVNGVWLPTSIESGKKGGPKTQRFTVESVEANVQVDDGIFRFPNGPGLRAIVTPERPAPLAGQAPAQKGPAKGAVIDGGVVSGLNARNIGSAAMSGRIAAIAGRKQDGKTVLFVGAASGGVWKSQDGGTTFKPVFDKQTVQSIGAVEIDPKNPQVVWVGTGESWTRNSVSVGDGIYKSTDGGESWTNMGLQKTERITRILTDPRNSNTVYACAPGKLWSDSPDRGLYKTSDGGKTWDLILTGSNLSTGCSTVAMDPKNPDVLFAGLWDFRRKGWTFRSGGEGAEAPSASALFKSTDGGKSWAEVKGLGPKPWGRVEVVIAPTNSSLVYAFVESTASALWRSADGGNTWEKRDDSQMMIWRPFYFARMAVDPVNPDRIFKMDLELIVSDDGGKSFTRTGGFNAHGDWHDLWIDPENPKHIVGGNDGGLYISFDGGNRWVKNNNLPVSQFYHVAVDDRDPYRVYGGLQDNSSWVAPSAYGGGISNAVWENLYTGDGFWVVPDPSDPDAVYAEFQGGMIARVDRRLQTARDVQPKANYKERLRYNWNTPIAASPTQKGNVYIGAQFLFRSRDRGDTWERISPDLTTNDPQKQKQEQSGGVTVDNSSAEEHTTIYSISESRFDPNTVWVGTDDGNLQLTRDGGRTWNNLVRNVKGLPPASWVSWVESSRYDAATAYAAFDRHTFGDMTPWVFRTTDYGRTWTRIVSPEQGVRGYAHVI